MESQAGHKNSEIWREINDPNRGYLVVLLSTILFYTLSIVAQYVQISSVVEKWKWKNISVSFIHSCITSVWALFCFFERPDMAEDLIATYTPLSHTLVAFSVGYFIYDLFDLYLSHRTRQSLELIGHHCVIITCFMVAVGTRHYVGYAVVALLVEVNSIFLHMRQLLQICGVSKRNSWYRFNSFINLATFIVFRIMLLAWMTRWLVINKDSVPLIFYTLGSLGLAVMVAMNIVLFYRLLRSDFIPSKGNDSAMKKKESTHRVSEAAFTSSCSHGMLENCLANTVSSYLLLCLSANARYPSEHGRLSDALQTLEEKILTFTKIMAL